MRVIVAEDSGFFREALVGSLQSSGIEVVGTAAETGSVVELVCETQPDVALLDICLPPTKTDEGLVLAEQLAEVRPETGVLLLSAYLATPHVTRILNAGRRNVGCLSKDQLHDADVLRRAIESIGRGETFIDPEFVDQRLHGTHLSDTLSPREMELLRSIAEGLSNQGISDRHNISVKTVERTLTSIFRKLRIDTTDGNARVRAVLLFLSRPQSFLRQQGGAS